MNKFHEQLASILDVAVVNESDVLTDFEAWDSLSVLSTIALLDSQYNVNLKATDLKGLCTVADLWKLVESKKNV